MQIKYRNRGIARLLIVAGMTFCGGKIFAAGGSCLFAGEPAGPSAIRLLKMNQGFDRPVAIVFPPDKPEAYYIVEQSGRLRLVTKNVVSPQPVLDLRSLIDASGNETGFLGMVFHPHFTQNRRFFVNYTGKSPLHTVVSEFRMEVDGSVKITSEKVLLSVKQPYSNHNGGNLAFGPDGYLYIGLGDGGSGGDPQGNGQNLKVLLGKMLRIDVDKGTPYGIPPSNPVFSDPQARKEIFAYGLRNPWRYSFDRVSGELWVGDVGQDSLEEIDVVKKGLNYGWNTMEGNSCFRNRNCDKTGLALPVIDYPRSMGASVTGGYVYRGQDMAELLGTYIYADYVSGKIWGLHYDGTKVTDNKVLIDSGLSVSSFGEDQKGELYVLDLNGSVYKIVRPEKHASADVFPRTLAATGCFKTTSPLVPIDGAVSYDISSALWSDGAVKERFIYIPLASGGSANPARLMSGGSFQFPENTVLIKNFYIPQRRQDSSIVNAIVETRFLVKKANGFVGYTYRWNDSGTEAELLGGASYRDVHIATTSGDESFSYYYPSGSDCVRCHAPGSGGALGFDAGHLNFSHPSSIESLEEAENELLRLVRLGVIAGVSLPADLTSLPALSNADDSTASIDQRARSYLQTQCANCHNRVFGTAQGNFDLRYALSFADMRVCNTDPVTGDLGISGAKVLKPGAPDQSLIWARMHSLDKTKRMPPLASGRRDDVGEELIKNWILGLEDSNCP